MRAVGLEEIKRIQLEILDSVHEFCKMHGLRYSLCGGTLLGAVKHKGYVPYDDDIDIMMPRKDYETFLSTYSDSQNFIIRMNKMDSCREIFSKVCRKGTKLVDPSLGRTTFSVFIDLCPIDGVPHDKHNFYMSFRQKDKLLPKLCAFYKDVQVNRLLWQMKYWVKRLTSGYWGNAIRLKAEIEAELKSNDLDFSPYASEMLVCYDEGLILKSEVFRKYQEYEFEGRKYMGIADYDTYLKSKYDYLGDYMNLPPLQKPLHEYTAYIED